MPTTTIRNKIKKKGIGRAPDLNPFPVYFGSYLGLWLANDWASQGTSFISFGEVGILLFSGTLGSIEK